MPGKESKGEHGTASLKLVASQLAGMVESLKTAAELLDTEPKVPKVTVRYENYLRDGLHALGTWVDEAKRTVNRQKLIKLQNGVSGTSDTSPEPKKPALKIARK